MGKNLPMDRAKVTTSNISENRVIIKIKMHSTPVILLSDGCSTMKLGYSFALWFLILIHTCLNNICQSLLVDLVVVLFGCGTPLRCGVTHCRQVVIVFCTILLCFSYTGKQKVSLWG